MIIGGPIIMHQEKLSDKLAIITKDETITYQQLYTNIQGVQQQLISMAGTTKEQKIGIMLGNSASFMELFFAVITLGWTAIPFDLKWSDHERELILKECMPDLLVNSPSIHKTLNVGNRAITIDELKRNVVQGQYEWSTDETDVFYIGYTSGTTGKPKGFIRTHRSWLSSFQGVADMFHFQQDDIVYVAGPLCHSLSLFAAVHAVHMGFTLYLEEAFQAAQAIALLKKEKFSVIYVVPTMLHALIETLENFDQQLFNNLKIISAGAKCSPELKLRVSERFPNAKLFEFYGASELSFVTYLDPKGNKEKPESVGKVFPGVEVHILKDNRTKAAIGEIGTLYVKSDFVFSGYVNDEAATKHVLQDGFATAGDVAYQDKDGYITLVGREKNMVISGGLNIYPEEVEAVLKQIPAIGEVVVMSVSDDYWGEKLVAVIKWRGSERLAIQELKEYCRSQLASYKCPREFFEVEKFAYTSSGKIARSEILQLIGERNI